MIYLIISWNSPSLERFLRNSVDCSLIMLNYLDNHQFFFPCIWPTLYLRNHWQNVKLIRNCCSVNKLLITAFSFHAAKKMLQGIDWWKMKGRFKITQIKWTEDCLGQFPPIWNLNMCILVASSDNIYIAWNIYFFWTKLIDKFLVMIFH